jgi:carbonic anhydrase
MLKFRDEDLRAKLIADPPKPNVPITAAVQSVSFLPFDDLKQSVLDDVAFLKEHPLVLAKSKLSGWIYNVHTGETTRVI